MSWSEVLYKYCARPQDFPQSVVYSSGKSVGIKDAYPKVCIHPFDSKAKHHFLLMPRERMQGLEQVDSVDFLKSMKSEAHEMLEKLKEE